MSVVDFQGLYRSGRAHDVMRIAGFADRVRAGVEIGQAPQGWLEIVGNDLYLDLARLELARRERLES